MKKLMKIWVIFMLIIPMHVWAEAIDVQLPEQEVFKVYDKFLAVENGQLGMRIEDKDRKWDYYEPKKIVGLQTVYLPFFKFYTENITHEIVNHLGERTEHEVRVCKASQS